MKHCPSCGTKYPDEANFCPLDAGHLEPDPSGTLPHGGKPRLQTDEGNVGGRYRVHEQIAGDRTGEVTDPFGHRWTLSTHVEDVSEAEMHKRAKELYG